jgi:MtaA/CmuA family methyltransferase
MKGKELIKKAFRRERVSRIPWVPFVGSHAAHLINASATDYLKSKALIIKGISKAIELYSPDGIPVIFDLQIEAEALGCELLWSDFNPPSVVTHPLYNHRKIEDLKLPTQHDGRIPMVIETTKELRKRFPDLALYGLITGPFTLALHLMGTDIFMKMFEEPEYVKEVMQFTTDVAIAMSQHYINAGCDVVAVVDPMVSQIDSETFAQFVEIPSKNLFSFIRSAGSLSSYFVCGDATQNIEPMCNCGPDNISIDENIDLKYVKKMASKYKISFGGNMQLTVVLLLGTPEDAQRNALECMDTGGKQGFILAPGCDLPMETPFENLVAVSELNRNELLQGELRAKAVTAHSVELLDLSKHWSNKKVIIDIITLDSSSCAPCQYMLDAVARAASQFPEKVVYKEHRIKEKQGIQMMMSLGVRNLPTIVIDGKIEFISHIPPVSQIEEKIKAYLLTKIE